MSAPSLELVGLGSMVVDRVRRVRRVAGADEKTLVRPAADGALVERVVGGVILNQFGWAAALGLRTGVFGRQAEDEAGRFLRDAMARAGIEAHLALDADASSVADIFVDDAGERAIYMAPGATAETTGAHLRERHAAFLRRGARFSTEVSQLPLEAMAAALRIAREAAIPAALDLDVPPSQAVPALGSEAELRELLGSVGLLKMSLGVARELLGKRAGALALARAARRTFGVSAVVVTAGESGCAVVARGFEGELAAARPKRVHDTTGAGDAFQGGLLAGRHYGLDWEHAARLANACGAACVEQVGGFPANAGAARARVLELYEGPPLPLAPPPEGGSEPPHEALASFDVALEELEKLRRRLRPHSFHAALELVRKAEAEGGRVHVTGVGKSEHVARYAAALLASTGTPATFLHATEAVHGSAGQVLRGDVVIAVSKSGETEELHSALRTVRALGARLVAVTGALDSWIARQADVTLDAGVAREGGGLGLAPRASVAAQLLVLASLGAALEAHRGFDHADFHARHPAGSLGLRTRPKRR